ncbi:hypothetical protein EWM64_g5478 [Hericium alpestre]|uniref:BTB domain-containing protein n=1 Tax=Hericium alpestre TaxID=135208 RepID=A0A4Y9ZWK8_9AGAM|nr:hypothetical protein EWM64_g5478 [Hericium alpestre]
MADPLIMRSKNHYYPDGSVTVQVGGILYRLFASMLARNSDVFADLFSIPPTDDPEGITDDKPIKLAMIPVFDFECLMDFLFRGPNMNKPHSIEFLRGLLHLSTRWEIPDGREYAIECLEKHCSFDYMYRLRFGVRYHVQDWIEPAFKHLAEPSVFLHELDRTRIENVLGLPVYLRLVEVKSRIDLHRRYLAFSPPPFQSGLSCKSSQACKETWLKMWLNGPAKMLIHPELPLSLILPQYPHRFG